MLPNTGMQSNIMVWTVLMIKAEMWMAWMQFCKMVCNKIILLPAAAVMKMVNIVFPQAI